MGLTALVVALGLTASAGTPELLILPPAPDGVSEGDAITAWKAVTAQLKKRRTTLGMSLGLQSEVKSALLGPGREKAWDCGTNTRCLTELGGTLAADFMVTGKISEDHVSLILLDVNKGRKVTGTRSSKKLKGQSVTRKAAAAARGLIKAYERTLGGDTKVSKKTKKTKKKKTKSRTDEGALAQADPVDSAGEIPDSAGELPDAPPPPPPPPPPPDVKPQGLNGAIRILPAQLDNVTSVSVDGAPLPSRPDGSMIWMGAAGSHSVAARRGDGATFNKEVLIDPKQVMDVTFEWELPTAPVFTGFEEEDDKPKTPFETWWFWAGVGGVVVAGGVASAVLIGGGKGGPSIPGNSGSISGTY